MPLFVAHDTLILDADCVINLYASGQMGAMLAAIPRTITVAAYVADKEALYVWSQANSSATLSKQPIRLQPFIEQGLLRLVQIDSEEEAEVTITFASMIRGQGEAITGAIAYCRNWVIVVDDKKARNLFTNYASQLQLLHTLDLVKHWADSTGVTPDEIADVLRNIRRCATYTPPADHPLYDWWHEHHGG